MERSQLMALLGTSVQPSTAEIRRSRRLVARRLHPDASVDLDPDVMSQLSAARVLVLYRMVMQGSRSR